MSNLEETFALQLRAMKLEGWKREHIFHPKRRWRFDFFHEAKNLAVEIEGGIWSGGRHTRGSGFQSDCLKYNAATEMGIRILRFTGDMIHSGVAIEQVERMVRS